MKNVRVWYDMIQSGRTGQGSEDRETVREGKRHNEVTQRSMVIAYRYLRHLNVSRANRMLLLQAPVPLLLGLVLHCRSGQNTIHGQNTHHGQNTRHHFG
jgi:hypothetical protein